MTSDREPLGHLGPASPGQNPCWLAHQLTVTWPQNAVRLALLGGMSVFLWVAFSHQTYTSCVQHLPHLCCPSLTKHMYL